MAGEHFIDLDELVLRCRTSEARRFIDEAVRCYKAGALRACVVMTWMAVVYDFVDKLRDLSMAGDKMATKVVDNFESLQSQANTEGLLRFERELLKTARKNFELLGAGELTDLERLQLDRHRCAHPALTSEGTEYCPSPELARAHIRHAVEHLLQHEPAQGKAALSRLERAVESQYFPTDVEQAASALSSSPFLRGRSSLVRNFTVVLLKTILSGTGGTDSVRRNAAAIGGAHSLRQDEVEAAFKEKENDLVSQLEDEKLKNAIVLFGQMPWLSDNLQEQTKLKLSRFVRQMPEADLATSFLAAFAIPGFEDACKTRAQALTRAEMGAVLDSANMPLPRAVLDRLVDLVRYSGDYWEANDACKLTVRIGDQMTKADVATLLEAGKNQQVLYAFEYKDLLFTLRGSGLLGEQSGTRR